MDVGFVWLLYWHYFVFHVKGQFYIPAICRFSTRCSVLLQCFHAKEIWFVFVLFVCFLLFHRFLLVWLFFFGGLFVCCCCFPAVKLPAFITHFCLMTLLHTCVQHFVQVKQNGGKCVKLHTNMCLLSYSVKFCNGAGLQAFFLKGAKSLLRWFCLDGQKYIPVNACMDSRFYLHGP